MLRQENAKPTMFIISDMICLLVMIQILYVKNLPKVMVLLFETRFFLTVQ